MDSNCIIINEKTVFKNWKNLKLNEGQIWWKLIQIVVIFFFKLCLEHKILLFAEYFRNTFTVLLFDKEGIIQQAGCQLPGDRSKWHH